MASLHFFKNCICLLLFISTFSGAYTCDIDTSMLESGEFCNGTKLAKNSPQLQLETYGNHQYYFATVFQGNYYKALEFCNYYDMELLSIENQEESDFLDEKLKNILSNQKHRFWTSGTIKHGNGHWIWLSTGRPIKYTNWKANHPNFKQTTARCLGLVYESGKAKWEDIHCTVKDMNFICKSLINSCPDTDWPFKKIAEK